jgi:hypothetical protein
VHLDFAKHKHFLAHTFNLYVGRDLHYPSYSGKTALIKVNFGHGAFQTELYDKFDHFTVVHGKETLFATAPTVYESEEVSYPSAFEVEESAEHKINGSAEFGFGFWTRWSRVFPKDIATKSDWYELARFTTNRNHNDVKAFGDRALAIFIGKGVYHFVTQSTTAEGGVNVYKNLDYANNLEGQWNYIYYSYQRTGNEGEARGYVHFSHTQKTAVISIPAL